MRYFTSERDGADVRPSVLDRQAANLTDEQATVYADPAYDADDNLTGTLRRVGGPVDVSGGWFDAGGGDEKFAYTGAYADGLMLLAARDFPGRYPALAPEATFGLNWLGKLWDPARKVLYVQVGIGNGNASDSIQGDYDYWFLPQQEDRLGATPGSAGLRAVPAGVRSRTAGPADRPATSQAGSRRLRPRGPARQPGPTRPGPGRCWPRPAGVRDGQDVRGQPAGHHVPARLLPRHAVEERQPWGASEIALASEAVHAPAAVVRSSVATAASWAQAYIAQGHPAGGDTLNLYDTGAVGEAELLAALRQRRAARRRRGCPGCCWATWPLS